MQLTAAGRVLREHAAQIITQTILLQQTMTDMVAGEAGQARLGAIETVAQLRLPPALAAFRRARPKVRLTVEVGGTGHISARVAAGDLDVGVCAPPPAHLGLAFEPLFTEPMALLMPATHPLALADEIDVASLAAHGLMLGERTCAYRQLIEQTLLRHGTNPYAGIEIGSMETLKRCVQAGMGLAIVPVAVATPLPEGTVLRDVVGLDLTQCIGLVRPADAGGAGRVVEALLATLRTHVKG
jgi:DNA-binding transcriptional LysR family regulator